jgi:hypothetical protein
LNVMAQYVDGELDSSNVTRASGQPMNGTSVGLNGVGAGTMNGAGTTNGTGIGMMNGNGARQAGKADAGDGSSSDKENWGHEYGRNVVGLGIQMNANPTTTNGSGGANNNTNGLHGSTPSSSTFTRKIDLGPLIGAKRGFRTREKVPFGGGVGGVEMVPSGSGVSFGAESTGGFVAESSGGSSAGSSSGLSSAVPDVWSSSFNTPAGSSNLGPNGGPSNWRPTISPSSASRASNSTRKSDRKGKGRAREETDMDADVDVEGDSEFVLLSFGFWCVRSATRTFPFSVRARPPYPTPLRPLTQTCSHPVFYLSVQALLPTRWMSTRRRFRRGCVRDGCILCPCPCRMNVTTAPLRGRTENLFLSTDRAYRERIYTVHPPRCLRQTGEVRHYCQRTVQHKRLETALRPHPLRAQWTEWISI